MVASTIRFPGNEPTPTPAHPPHPPPRRPGRAAGGGQGCMVRTTRHRYGGHSGRETPGPIPNPEAKPASADGTAWGTAWESRTPPDTHQCWRPHQKGPPPLFCASRICVPAATLCKGARQAATSAGPRRSRTHRRAMAGRAMAGGHPPRGRPCSPFTSDRVPRAGPGGR